MATKKQRERLIEAIAFIRTHRRKWDQGLWVRPGSSIGSCGTVGCLAGHIAITLNPSKPLVTIPAAVAAKKGDQLTADEQNLVSAAFASSEYVTPTAKDDPAYIRSVWLDALDDERPAIHVRHRAAMLLGDLMSFHEADSTYGLFSGKNDLRDIYRIAAEKLGITVSDLKRECDALAIAKGWTK